VDDSSLLQQNPLASYALLKLLSSSILVAYCTSGFTYYCLSMLPCFLRMPPHFLLGASLASLPLASTAQTNPLVSVPHFYVGLGASALSYAPASTYSSLSHFGPSLTLGAQFDARWALQVGATFSKRRDADSQSFVSSPGQLPTFYEYDNRISTLTVPLLARYTLDSHSAHVYADVLGGITLLHAALHSTSSSTTAGQSPYRSDERSTVNRASLSAGLAARYSLLPQLELTADGLAHVTVTNSFYKFSDRFFVNLLVGLRYNFGQG
jgi:hypothetical protein